MSMRCNVCGAAMVPDVLQDTYRCERCGFYKSSFTVHINKDSHIDHSMREAGLKPLRISNFKQILSDVENILPPKAYLLDVGCANGWFLEEASKRGYRAIGLEPDREIIAIAHGDIIQGFFPEDARETYDAITFHDVFEHLPEPDRMMSATAERLKPGGHAIINLPVSNGLAFRASRFFARLGILSPFERVWQKGLPTPHLSYFSTKNLEILAQKNGLDLVRSARMDAMIVTGLWNRIRCTGDIGLVRSSVFYVASLALHAVSRLAPPDFQYFVFTRHQVVR